MIRRKRPARARRAAALGVAVLALSALLVAAGCQPVDQPRTEKAVGPVYAPTAEATLPASTAPLSGDWPDKVGTFAAAFKGPTWYPASLPKSMKIVSLDVVEMEKGSGLVCDIVYSDGKNFIQFTQGSPKLRTYDTSSSEKVAWGPKQANVVFDDPQTHQGAKTIVYSDGRTLGELIGDVSEEELKAVAASMHELKP